VRKLCCGSTGSGTISIAARRHTRNAISGFVQPSRKFVRYLLAMAIVV
jgi:hypothetical protein